VPASPVVEIAFALSAFIILVSSLAVVLVKNPVRATLLLIVSFLPTSLVYILLQASFVGILQILVYAGAIMMLFTFVIMMINPAPKEGETAGMAPPGTAGHDDHSSLRSSLIAFALLIGAGALILPAVYTAASHVSTAPVSKPGFGELASIADLLFKDPENNPLTVSFELISFLILVGIIAALNYSRRKGASEPRAQEISTRPTELLPKLSATMPVHKERRAPEAAPAADRK
jgi:NADH-quinone oxidoreductase subunit J